MRTESSLKRGILLLCKWGFLLSLILLLQWTHWVPLFILREDDEVGCALSSFKEDNVQFASLRQPIRTTFINELWQVRILEPVFHPQHPHWRCPALLLLPNDLHPLLRTAKQWTWSGLLRVIQLTAKPIDQETIVRKLLGSPDSQIREGLFAEYGYYSVGLQIDFVDGKIISIRELEAPALIPKRCENGGASRK